MKPPGLAQIRRALPGDVAPLVDAVLEVADAQGVPVYLVGGPVRDLLLGRAVRDVDLLVDAPETGAAAELARAAAPADARVVQHDRFGTVALQGAAGSVDLAGVRSETYAHEAALPEVASGSLEQDLERRDFTVNAIALPLSRPARARRSGIVAVERGLQDLERRVLRVLHPRSFHDDPTRALRAARLAARLGFSVSRGTRVALRDALRSGAFGRVSGDRLRREVVKLFDEAALGLDPARALRLLSDWHVLGALEPGLVLPRESAGPLRRLGRTAASPPWRAQRWRPWICGLALWLAPLPPGLRRRSLARFSVRGAGADRIRGCIAARDARLRALARARGRGAVDALLGELHEEELQTLYAWAPPALRRRVLRYASEDRQRRNPVNGEDLIALGFAGPAVGRALGQIRSAFLDGAVSSREEALALAREIARRRTGPRRRAAARARPG